MQVVDLKLHLESACSDLCYMLIYPLVQKDMFLVLFWHSKYKKIHKTLEEALRVLSMCRRKRYCP